MDISTEQALHHAVGMADLASLLAVAFRYNKDERLGEGLANGTFAADWHASWLDAATSVISAVTDPLTAADEAVLSSCTASGVNREFSRLFLTPGLDTPVWPYESAFYFRKEGVEETPNLFLTASTLDVERQMADAGVRPESLHIEPTDTVNTELEFLSYLYAALGDALYRESRTGESVAEAAFVEDASAAAWRTRIARFATTHALVWLPEFSQQVIDAAETPEFKVFARLLAGFLELLEPDSRA